MADLYNHDFEGAVIGGLMLEPQLSADINAIVGAGDFHNAAYALAFDVIAKLVDAGKPVDFMVVADECEKLSPRGDWLTQMATVARHTPSTANVLAYAQGVAEYSTLRKLHTAGQDVCRVCFDPALEISEKIARAQQSVLGMMAGMGRKGAKNAKEALTEWYEHLRYCSEADGGLTGISWGLSVLDDMTSGMHGGELLILAARPGQGKTVSAIGIAAEQLRAKRNVMFFSLEMQARELIGRLASAMTGTFYKNIQTADLDAGQWQNLQRFVEWTRNSGLYIDDNGDLTIADIRARARAQAAKGGLDLVIVDYLQLVGGAGENETIKVGSVSRGLKQMAKELDCPVLALSQLNRGMENRPDPRPRLSDLRQSGQIEQDADAVLFLHRHDELHTELIVEKLRHGQPGSVWLEPQFHTMRFVEGRPFIPEQKEQKNTRGFRA